MERKKTTIFLRNMKIRKYLYLIILAAFFQSCGQSTQTEAETSATDFYTIEDFASVKKFDSHFHINIEDTTAIRQAKKDNFRLLTVNVETAYYPTVEAQEDIAVKLINEFPDQISYATTFSVKNWDSPTWEQETLAYLKDSFEKGAIAVKVWKNIGMELRDKDGSFVMMDDPRFTPILDFIEKNNITLVAHLGEPRNAWLPVEEMTVAGDKSYFTQHPEYHMYLHPEYPSYEDQIDARDNVLKKHPNLKVIAAHLASLEWNVDELAKRLDAYPNLAVDMAARISHLQHQSILEWQKVHDFMIKYQDRLVYATDHSIRNPEGLPKQNESIHNGRMRDWTYFTSDEEMTIPSVEGAFKGLKLPKQVIDKIYYKNAENWLNLPEIG